MPVFIVGNLYKCRVGLPIRCINAQLLSNVLPIGYLYTWATNSKVNATDLYYTTNNGYVIDANNPDALDIVAAWP